MIMKKNLMPSMANREMVLASDLRRQGSSEALVGTNGELNAQDKGDLLRQVAHLLETAATHNVTTESRQQQERETAKVHREMVLAAFDSKEELAALGDMMAENLTITANRDGFMRRLLQYQDLVQGQRPAARMNTKSVEAAIATGPTQTRTSFVRDNLLYPPEFYITSRPYIEQRDIDQSSDDVLEEKYTDALEAIMVNEDRSWKRMADSLVGLQNPHLNISGQLTPQAFAELTDYVTRWGIPAATALMASDLWKDIVSNAEWHTVIDPVAQHELLLTGRLGTVHGMELVSDYYRHPQHKVLNQGELYIVGAPDQHGQYTDRGGVTSQPIDGTQERVPGRGWFMSETISMVIANGRSLARGRRQ